MDEKGTIESKLSARGREMLRVVDEQDRSGRTIEEFARLRGLNAGTLGWWRSKIRRLREARSPRPPAKKRTMPALVPVKVIIDAQTVFLCCAGCKDQALADAKGTLEIISKLKQSKPAPRR